MRFGAACDIEKLPVLKAEGYDYIELCFSDIAAEDDRRFLQAFEQTERCGIYAECLNGFFKPDIRLNGNVDYGYIADYAQRGFSRAQKLGGKIAVLGSGDSRRIPDGYDRRTAAAQFAKILNICGDIAGNYGMQIAIEPLRTEETNFINTVAQGIEMCTAAGNPHVKCLADFYHVYMNNEPLDTIENAAGMLIHTHIARPDPDRNIPSPADLDGCRPWAQALKKNGYNGRMSLEGFYKPDFETALRAARPVLEMFRED